MTDTGSMGARLADASCGAGGAGLVGTAREDVEMVLLLMIDVAVTSDVENVLATDRFVVLGTDATVARGSNGVGGMDSRGEASSRSQLSAQDSELEPSGGHSKLASSTSGMGEGERRRGPKESFVCLQTFLRLAYMCHVTRIPLKELPRDVIVST